MADFLDQIQRDIEQQVREQLARHLGFVRELVHRCDNGI